MIKVAVIDDDALIRESLGILLEGKEGIHIVGFGENGLEALRLAPQCDVMLLDLRMPLKGGLDVLKEVAAQTRVLVLTTFDDDAEIVKALRGGAHGYLLKSAKPAAIIQAIAQLHQGKSVFDEVALEALRRSLKPASTAKLAELSERENEIVKAIADGLSNRQIADALFISEGTVKNHITAILQKTGLAHRTQIAVSHLKGEL
ncbi:MAG: response regulator transcription factor [Clostridiales bacterium]|nr:response regulator transcription factor [Clostridiales bacterium]